MMKRTQTLLHNQCQLFYGPTTCALVTAASKAGSRIINNTGLPMYSLRYGYPIRDDCSFQSSYRHSWRDIWKSETGLVDFHVQRFGKIDSRKSVLGFTKR